MQCYVRQGERAEALHQYRVCVETLHAEFDAAPETATTMLFEQIRLDLRLLLYRRGALIQGELVDVAEGRPARFAGWRVLIRTVRTWLKGQAAAGASDDS